MLPLRYPWIWATLGWLLVVGVIVGSLVPARMLHAITIGDKHLHAASYFLLMVWFAGLYPRSRHLLIALVLFALGALLDMLQATTATRTFDLYDILADGIGVAVGLAVSLWVTGGWCQRVERLLPANS